MLRWSSVLGKAIVFTIAWLFFLKKIRQNFLEIIFEKQSFIGFFVFKINYQNELQEDPLYKGDSFLMWPMHNALIEKMRKLFVYYN